MNLSRRSLLTGLLSSAAVIAAGPVAKVIPVDDPLPFGNSPGLFALEDMEFMEFLEGMTQRVFTTMIYDNLVSPLQFIGFTPAYDGLPA